MRSAPPESVACCYLLDQADRFGREPRLSRPRLRFVLPEPTEELPMEAAKVSPAERGRAPVTRPKPSWPEAPGAAGPSSGRRVA
jgi:hypothetical protein